MATTSTEREFFIAQQRGLTEKVEEIEMSVMSKERYVDTLSIMPDIEGIRFREHYGESDYPKMLKVVQQTIDADGLERVVTLDDVINTYTYLSNFDPEKDLRIVEVEGVVVGYVRVNWNETIEGYLVYRHIANLLPEWRQKGIGTAMLRFAEARIDEISRGHISNTIRFFEVGAEDVELGKIALFEREKYQPVRYFFEMTRDLGQSFPDAPLPDNLEIRTVKPEHYRLIWDAEVEAFRDHWGFREKTEEEHQWWLNDRLFQPELWNVAWDGDQVAGMVLNFIDHDENVKFDRKRGYTEDISVRRPWRRRGLAKSLLVQSMADLKHLGMTEANLGVDTENPNGARGLYEGLGFRPVRRFTNYRKQLT
jgi:ribosomal protein S18 acetylase RimI-like enzyme